LIGWQLDAGREVSQLYAIFQCIVSAAFLRRKKDVLRFDVTVDHIGLFMQVPQANSDLLEELLTDAFVKRQAFLARPGSLRDKLLQSVPHLLVKCELVSCGVDVCELTSIRFLHEQVHVVGIRGVVQHKDFDHVGVVELAPDLGFLLQGIEH